MGGVFRKGVRPGTQCLWEICPGLTATVHEAFDHAGVPPELDL
jgi:hypothetical protein